MTGVAPKDPSSSQSPGLSGVDATLPLVESMIDRNHPRLDEVRERAYTILNRVIEEYGLTIPRESYPEIGIALSSEQTSGFLREGNFIVFHPRDLDRGSIYGEELFHWLRDKCHYEPQRGFKERTVEEFFGRLGESVVATLFKDHEYSALFQTPRDFLSMGRDSNLAAVMDDGMMKYRYLWSRATSEEERRIAELSFVSALAHCVGYGLAELYVEDHKDFVEQTKGLLFDSVDTIIASNPIGGFIFTALVRINFDLAEGAMFEWNWPDVPHEKRKLVPTALKFTGENSKQ